MILELDQEEEEEEVKLEKEEVLAVIMETFKRAAESPVKMEVLELYIIITLLIQILHRLVMFMLLLNL